MTTLRKATPADMPAVWQLIYELSVYEKAPEAVIITPDDLVRDGFEKQLFTCIVAELDAQIVGMALYYTRYSTWKGLTVHLEDFIVQDQHRGKGIGKLLFDAFVKAAHALNPGRIEWTVLEWNSPAIKFYEKVGATLDPQWLLAQMSPEQTAAYIAQPDFTA
jgi:GNAT superfamily N-acetyltransferase